MKLIYTSLTAIMAPDLIVHCVSTLNGKRGKDFFSFTCTYFTFNVLHSYFTSIDCSSLDSSHCGVPILTYHRTRIWSNQRSRGLCDDLCNTVYHSRNEELEKLAVSNFDWDNYKNGTNNPLLRFTISLKPLKESTLGRFNFRRGE